MPVVPFRGQPRDLPTEQPFHVNFASELVEATPVEWIIPDLIPRGTVSLLAGAEFLGKTFLCQHLMIALGLGREWFGRQLDRCRSYAIFSEDPHERVLVPRRNRILEYYAADFHDLDEYCSWTASTARNPVFDSTLYRCERFQAEGRATELWAMVLTHCADLGVSLLVIDNASMVLRGQEADQVLSFCRMLMSAATKTGMAILLLAHPPKDRSAVYAGTANWARALRHILVLERPKDADDQYDDGRRILRLYASNWTGERPRIHMRWEQGMLVPDEAPIEVARKWPLSQSERRELDYKVLHAMRTVIERGGRVVADAAHSLSMPGRTRSWSGWHFSREEIDDSVDRLVKAGQAKRVGKEVVPV